jgi:hypothetical protein
MPRPFHQLPVALAGIARGKANQLAARNVNVNTAISGDLDTTTMAAESLIEDNP